MSSRFAVAALPTPIFNTPRSPFLKKPLALDPQGRLMEIETVALPGTKFTILSEGSLVEVATRDYPSQTPLYVDRRFLQPAQEDTPERIVSPPKIDSILTTMLALRGTRYFWGGNWPQGIPEMRTLYPGHSQNDLDVLCQGVDCSGLLYYATHGATPRNTGDLTKFGHCIPIEGLEPLDLIVWKGHILIVVDSKTVIESRIGHGVVVSPLQQRLEEVRKLTEEQGKELFYRRWYPNILRSP